jgi:two-component sensor histidine kinase
VISLPICGGAAAPRTARHAVLSRLDGWVTDEMAQDAALVVSELVTNSVLHAELDADDTVLVELALDEDQLAITVTDPGSGVPRLLRRDPGTSHGFGLRLVNDISTSWGVRRKAESLQVWCEFALGGRGLDGADLVAWGRGGG